MTVSIDERHDDLFGEAFVANPYPALADLREHDPVHWNERYQLWMITRYEDVVALIRNHDAFSSVIVARDERPPYPPIDVADAHLWQEVREFRGAQVVEQDGPKHASMRGLLHDFFTPKAVERWRPFIRAAVDQLVTDAIADGEADLLTALAAPLPVAVIAEMMGIPASDRPYLRQLADKLLYLNRGEPGRLRPLVEGIRAMCSYVEPLATTRTSAPSADFISVLAAGEQTGRIDRQEVLANAALLLFAGHETTTNLICNGVRALLSHATAWRTIVDDPDATARRATEECLRYDPPVKSTQRIVSEDIELRGKRLRRGDRVRWFIAAANRDPRVFVDPDTFRIERYPNPHVSFGGGIHHCLGAALARIEGQEVLSALARRLPLLALAGEPAAYEPSIQFRSMRSLRVSWRAVSHV